MNSYGINSSNQEVENELNYKIRISNNKFKSTIYIVYIYI